MDFTKEQLDTAKWLIRFSRGRPEDQIRQRIVALLGSLDIDCEMSYHPAGGADAADIYLPRRRTFIETKAVGRAEDPYKPQHRPNDESPKEQLERYLRAETQYELNSLQFDEAVTRPWTGIVTDGQVWHVWHYAHENDASSSKVVEGLRPATPEELLGRLQGFLDGDLVGKPWIPANPQSIFAPYLEELREVHAGLSGVAEKHTQTKRGLWLDMLRTASMEPGNEAARQRLFVAHSFLVALARGVIQALESGNRVPRVEDILGDGFISWILETTVGEQWGRRLLAKIASYEWRRRPGDVLRPLYENFVGEKDRKVFGEFYTPDWLAEIMVREVCDDEWCKESTSRALTSYRTGSDVRGAGVLDPTCGSGTFLYHAARRLLKALDDQFIEAGEKAAVVCMLVQGIDIHPVAAEIARATLMRALPARPPRGKGSLQIHEGDALMIRDDNEESLFHAGENEVRITTPRGSEIFFPMSFVNLPSFAGDLLRLVYSASTNAPLPADIPKLLPPDDRQAIDDCYERFKEVVQEEGNSVWAWYIRNITGPYRLAEKKINRIVANPPWVKMAEIQSEDSGKREGRKQVLEDFAQSREIALWPGGEQAPQFDIAQLFIKRTRQLYIKKPDSDPAAWLVKKSALLGGNWKKFREWHESLCAQTLDLEKLQPFGGGDARRSCILFENRVSSLEPTGSSSVIASVEGVRPKPSQGIDDVLDRLRFTPAPPVLPQKISDFVDNKRRPLFRNGATIFPSVLTVLAGSVVGSGSEQVSVRTRKSDHKPWKSVEQQVGEIPARWVQPIVVSKALLPFVINPRAQPQAIIPINEKGKLDNAAIAQSEFWKRLDRIYREHKGTGKSTPTTLLNQIDYAGKLSAQLVPVVQSRTMVAYPTSGDIMRACRLSPGKDLIGHTLFRMTTTEEAEAKYLVALLNAPCLNAAFVQSRTSGRHFSQHPWRKVPIRRFDPKDTDHVALASLAERAEEIAEAWLASSEAQAKRLGQVALSSRIRKLLQERGVLGEIDRVVRKILPNQASEA